MSLSRYKEYVNVQVGWPGQIPSHWSLPPLYLRYQAELGKMLDTSRITGRNLLPYLRNVDVQWNNINLDDLPEIDIELSELSRYTVRVGDLLICEGGEVGRAAVVDTLRGPTAFQKALHRLRAIQSDEVPKYMFYVFCWAANAGIFTNNGQSTIAHLTGEQLRKCRFPCPPFDEQTAIAAFLDRETAKIDTLIAEQEKLIALLAEKRQATISRAVTKGLNPNASMKDSGLAWLGEVPAHWDVVGLTKYLDCVVDYRGRTPEKVDSGIFLVTAKNIRNGVLDYDASQEYIESSEYDDVMRRGRPMRGDVLFTTEAPLGQVALVDREDIALAQRIIKFRASSSRLLNSYLKVWIMGRACQFNLEQLATGSTALGIKGSKIGQIRLCLPPLREQKEIVFFIDAELAKLDKLTREAELAIGLLRERRSALITAAVTGQIDVRAAVPQAATESPKALAA